MLQKANRNPKPTVFSAPGGRALVKNRIIKKLAINTMPLKTASRSAFWRDDLSARRLMTIPHIRQAIPIEKSTSLPPCDRVPDKGIELEWSTLALCCSSRFDAFVRDETSSTLNHAESVHHLSPHLSLGFPRQQCGYLSQLRDCDLDTKSQTDKKRRADWLAF